MSDTSLFSSEFNGLTSVQPTLPLSYYFDATQYARELDLIWARNWIYLCRADEISAGGDYRVFIIAGREIIVIRNEHDELVGYFNSCRHRGSVLTLESQGCFKHGRITCPYHSWSYDLSGRLVATGKARPIPRFNPEQYGLHSVTIAQWRGFVFANLNPGDATELEDSIGEEFAPLNNWPLEQLQVAHRFSKTLQCNWKLFWENFNECLHCPNVHPDLSRLVPIYRRGLMVRNDDPEWRQHVGDTDPRLSGRLRDGACTWSDDGEAVGPSFADLTQSEVEAGHTYAVALPSLFVVGHIDYVRAVRVTPLDSESMQISAEWLVLPEALAKGEFDVERAADFAKQVMLEDGRVCEINQRGIRSSADSHGVLMQEEYEVFAFQEWIRRQLGEPALANTHASRASRRKERG